MKNALKLILAVFVMSPSVAFCATPIYEITEANGTFVQVPLQYGVFQYTTSTTLDDLVVLDSSGNSLPYRVVAVTPQNPELKENISIEPLAFFPVAPDATPDTLRKLHTTQVSINENKTQVITSDKTLNNAIPEFYLIDVSKVDHDLSGISVDWSGQANNQYLEVELEATHDLSTWFPVAKTTLIRISQDGESLTRNLIAIKILKKDFEFLRIKILRGAENLVITKIFGEQRTEQLAEKPLLKETWSVKGKVATSQATVYVPNSHSKAVSVAAWEFERDEIAPIDKIAIDFGTTSYAGGVKILSRDDENKKWSLRHQGIWFNTQVGDSWEKSTPINNYPNRDRFWRIELNESARSIPNPSLIVGWQPYQLQIITNNKPPYTLAVETDKKAGENRDQVFNQILSATNPQWVEARLKSLDASPTTFDKSKKAVDWKQWLFWVALILAVGVLLAFSLKLLKQLNSTKTI